jgi:signal recognition particle subunit SRP54
VVLLAGLQGSGKTTTSAKLARWWKQQGRHPLLVGADLQRPAAVEQLRVLGAQAGVTVFSEPTDPVAVARAGVEEARRLGRDVCIIDTAGRLAIDEELMDEVRRVSAAVEPHYTLLVVDAMTGQDAVATARAFHRTLALDGVILTKLDGDARGGAALSVKEVVGRPIAFASTGEKLDDFDLFHPDRMADRILGMGDVLSLIEQAERTMDRDTVERSASALMEGRFTLEDFLEQLQQVRKMGSIGGIMKLLPGMSKEMRQAADQIDDGEISKVEAIVRSMTPKERVDPALIDGSRRVRIARGSGTSTQDVNHLLKQFREMQKMMKGMAGGAGLPGMPQMGGGKMGGLLGARRQMEALRSLQAEGGDDGLAALFGDGATAPPAALSSGARPSAAPAKGSRGGGKKKKKGGRVTPPKGR